MVSYNKSEQTRRAVCAQTPSPLSMRLAHGGTRLSDTLALARRSARPTEAYMQRRARETGRRGARKLPKTTLHACALSLHHTDATGQRRTRARPRERSRHPTCRCSLSAWCRARTRCVCAAPERGDSAADLRRRWGRARRDEPSRSVACLI